MAILKKRTSSKQLPQARGFERNPLSSVVRNFDDEPSISGGRTPSITSTGGTGGSNTTTTTGGAGALAPSTNKPVLTGGTTTKPTLTSTTTKPAVTTKPITTKPAVTKPAVTTKPTTTTKPTVTTPTTKPSITTKTPTTPTTKTTTPTSVVKPTVTTPKTNTNSTTSKVVNALTGAALGAGTKLLIDKITGKPVVAPAGSTVKPPAGSTVKPPAGSTVKPPTTSTVKPPAGGTTKPATGGTSATDVYKGTPADPSLGLPEGAIDNGDGTYTVGNTTYSMKNDSVLYTTDADGKITVAGEVPTDKTLSDGETVVAENTDTEYFTDELGNIYTQNSDGTYALYEGDDASTNNTTVAENTDTEYFSDELGNVYTQNSDGTYALYESADDPLFADDATFTDDTLFADGATFEDDVLLAGDPYNYDESDYLDYDYSEFAKRGGLITMMKNGGVPHFVDGGETYLPDEAEDNGDGTFTLGNDVFDMETGDPLYSMNSKGEIIYVEPSTMSGYVDNDDGTYTLDGITYDMSTDMPLYTEDAKGNIILAKDNGDGTYNFGNETFNTSTGKPLYTTNTRTGKLDVAPTAITSAGGGNRKPTVGNVLSEGWDTVSGIGKDALSAITGALGTTAGAAGAGALVATLLGQDFGGGGTGAQNQGLDMSKVGLINPRTTDFGIGPTNFVGYDDYGTDGGDYTPNEELLRNLNAPGYNPVNEGDYGYEEVATDEAETPETPAMASGGLSSMQTPVASYYTFGQPADILANLGMRQQPPTNPPEMMPQIGQQNPQIGQQNTQQRLPQQGQQQAMQKQMPDQITQQTPFGAPQQGMMPQQMRRGGLPHVSDVPLVQGRMDFRQGAAVHGEGDGQSDDIPAMLADGEYVIDADTVAQIGNGSTKAGAQALDRFREGIRAHKRSAPVNKIPPKTKPLTSYLKGAR